VNKKQCQKCGEENPPEAVMCWACYTPLSGGAAPTSSAASRQAAAKDDTEKKGIAPWQMGVMGLALVLGLGIGVKTLLLPGSADVDTSAAPGKASTKPGAPAMLQPVPFTPGTPTDVTLPNAPPVTPGRPLMIVEVPPNPKMEIATMGIVPTEQNVSSDRAASLAVQAHQSVVNSKRFKMVQIFVFSDQQAATMFREYQKPRRGAPLELGDYEKLAQLWRRTPAVYEFKGTSERWISPARWPNDWWKRIGRFRPRS